MSETAQEIETSIESLDLPEQLSILRRLESLAWGAPLWLFLARVFANRADTVLDSSETPDECAFNDELNRAALCRFAEKYGRVLNKKQVAWMKRIRATGVAHLTIRDAVIGRLMTRNGTTNLSPYRRWLLMTLGIAWHVIAILATILLTILAAMLPGPLEAKLLVVPAIVTFGVFALAFINALTLRPIMAHKTIVQSEARSVQRSLRVL
jgi:hypothetical protein